MMVEVKRELHPLVFSTRSADASITFKVFHQQRIRCPTSTTLEHLNEHLSLWCRESSAMRLLVRLISTTEASALDW